jgi:mono/diheme cytochrome c family protein
MRTAHASKLMRLAAGMILLASLSLGVQAQPNPANGQYLAKAGGCVGCHTDTKPGSVPFAGGRALETPFGVFYGPNITPHRQNGLGAWSDEDFKRAIRHGERRDGSHYFPAFPYPSFTGMTDRDIADLWAYLKTLPPAGQANREHALRFPFGWRFLITGWKLLYFTPGPLAEVPAASPAVGRGAYLVRVLGHCGECHTPRTAMGGPRNDSLFAGAKIAEGKVPNLTPTRLKKWKDSDLKEYFHSGTTPGGDIAVEPMNEVINNTTSQLTKEDIDAVIAYLRSLPPQPEPK